VTTFLDVGSADEVLAAVRELAARLRADGADEVRVAIDVPNDGALAVLRRLGFTDSRHELVADLAALEPLLAGDEAPSYGSVHVQTDDQVAVEKAVARFVPRVASHSRSTVISAPRSGWIAVYDEVAVSEPDRLRRLASELSNLTGGVVIALGAERGEVVRLVAFDRGRIADEYLSVPEYYGTLPPGDAIALRANPTLLARLTGAQPSAIRAIARTADSPAELPPARELVEELAEVLGIEGAGLDFEEARQLEGAVTVEHGA